MNNIYFLNLDIADNLAGVESSALARTKLFSDHLGITPVFLTNIYNWRLHKNKKKVQNNHRASENMSVLNMYDYFQEATGLEHGEKKILATDLKPYRPVEIEGTHDLHLYDEKGELIAYCNRHSDDLSINFINYLKQGVIWRRETYDTRGFLSKAELLEKKDDHEIGYESFFRPDGSIAITKKTLIKNGISQTLSIGLTSNQGRLIKQFNSEPELLAYWLDIIVKNNDNSTFIIDRCAEFYSPTLSAISKHKSNSKIIPVIHSVHTGGDVYRGEINKFYKTVLDDISKPDSIVVFTEEQKTDIKKRFGDTNIHTIPHSHEEIIPTTEFALRQHNKVVYIARYSPEKNHDLALNAFKIVVDNIPDAELHLYGFGEKRQDIINQVNELKLEKNVYINDFTPNINPIYQSAGLSILTSGVEGFCLGIMESLFNGCPVISFDIKYGPRFMIKDNINGYLINFRDINMMADKIIQVIKNKNLHAKLVSNAATSVKDLQHNNIAERWSKLITQNEKSKTLQTIPDTFAKEK